MEMLGDEAFEVEFIAASGRTQALVTLHSVDVRTIGDKDLIAVRRKRVTAAARSTTIFSR